MSDWRDRQVKDLGEIITGRTPSTKRKDFYGGDYNLISPADLDNGKYIRTTHKRLTKLGFEQCFPLPRDTVLVGCIGNVGKLGMVDNEQSATNQQINALLCNSENDPEFVYYCFHENRDKLEKCAVKTTVPILNKTNFGNFQLKVPPLFEQKKIAFILSTVQRAIEAQERIIQTTTELKKALMHKLFTEGLHNEPQKQTEIGSIPESWEVISVGELAAVKGGKRLPKGEKLVGQNTGYPYIRITDFNEFGVNKIGLLFLTEEVQNQMSRYIINQDNVFISIAGSIGITGMIPPELDGANLTENAARLIVNNSSQLYPRFLMYWLASHHCQGEIKAQTVKNAQPKLALARIKSLKVLLPTLKEQTEITDALDLAQHKTEIARSFRVSLQDIFRTLLHKLMTAKTRVNVLQVTPLG